MYLVHPHGVCHMHCAHGALAQLLVAHIQCVRVLLHHATMLQKCHVKSAPALFLLRLLHLQMLEQTL